jgi:predicted glutamine amidotransferase
VVVQTPWSQRRRAVFVASEKMTDEPWQTIDDGMLLRLDRTPQPRWRLIA